MMPRLLDLFCGAGGAAKGYQRAGFYVVGVDIEPQPNYCGDEFVQVDVLDFLHPWQQRLDFDAVHASPPCQQFTAYRRRGAGVGDRYADEIATVRRLLNDSRLPYVIENVEGAPLLNPVTLCGCALGLDVRRHRLFESSVPLIVPPCGCGAHREARFPAATNREPNSRRTVEIGVWRIPLETQQQVMGIDWMTLEELSEAIPPAYTELIGHQLVGYLRSEQAA